MILKGYNGNWDLPGFALAKWDWATRIGGASEKMPKWEWDGYFVSIISGKGTLGSGIWNKMVAGKWDWYPPPPPSGPSKYS